MGAIDGSAFISHELPLASYVEGIEIVHAGKDSLKVLLKP
jgi:hypothetical protein